MAPRPTPTQALRRHPVLAVAAVALTTAAAVGAATTLPVSHTAEARLAVASTSLSAQAVPGFALASQELAANYARYVNDAEAQRALETGIGADRGSVLEVTASPIPESSIVRIEVVAEQEAAAVEAAREVSESLVAQVSDATAGAESATSSLTAFTDISAQVAAAEQAAQTAQRIVDDLPDVADADEGSARRAAARQAAADAAAELAVLEVQQDALGERYRSLVVRDATTEAGLAVVQEAVAVGDDRTSTLQRAGLVGAALGLGLAVLATMASERRRARRRARRETVARTQVSEVDGPGADPAPPLPTRPLARTGTARDDHRA